MKAHNGLDRMSFVGPAPPVPAQKAQSNLLEADGQTAGQVYGEEEEAAWYLTKAMAASSLQNSSSTITPSNRDMWSILHKKDMDVRHTFIKKIPSEDKNFRNHCGYIHDALWL